VKRRKLVDHDQQGWDSEFLAAGSITISKGGGVKCRKMVDYHQRGWECEIIVADSITISKGRIVMCQWLVAPPVARMGW
jgi:hypothetical protein